MESIVSNFVTKYEELESQLSEKSAELVNIREKKIHVYDTDWETQKNMLTSFHRYRIHVNPYRVTTRKQSMKLPLYVNAKALF